MRKVFGFALVIFLISAHASADTVTLVTGEWVPYTSEKMEGYGFITEIVSEVFKEMGAEAEYKFYPWRRCYHLVKSGKVWGAFPYSHTEERQRRFCFPTVWGRAKLCFSIMERKKIISMTPLRV